MATEFVCQSAKPIAKTSNVAMMVAEERVEPVRTIIIVIMAFADQSAKPIV